MSTPKHDLGLSIRREVLGDEYVDRALSNVDDFNPEFQELLNEYCWGGNASFETPAVAKKMRSLNGCLPVSTLARVGLQTGAAE